MCGIAGVFFAHPERPPEIAKRMNAVQRHRGPDADGCANPAGAIIGHTRLSIIDLSEGGAQPMRDPSGRFWLTFNGEIFNYRELRHDLEKSGVVFRSQSDTEVLLQLLILQGPGGIPKLRGQFAFALWDSEEQRLLCARDRFGEKPLYWAQTDRNEVVLASEARAILASGLVKEEVDPDALQLSIALLYTPPGISAFKGILTLPPGHVLTAESGKVNVQPYWEPSIATSPHRGPTAAAEIAEETLRLLKQAVKRQMVADVPVGAFLSGGLDSSTIVALAADGADGRLMTFAAGFGDLINELPFAREVAQRYGTAHHELQMDMDLGELLPVVVNVFDEPFPDSSALPTWCLARFTRQHCTVALSGDGGDEIFGGYSWYRRHLGAPPSPLKKVMAQAAKPAAEFLRRAGMGKAAARMRPWVDQANEAELRHHFSDPVARHLVAATDATRFGDAGLSVQGSTLRSLPDLIGRLNGYPHPTSGNGFTDVTRFDVLNYLPGDILVKVDRASMAHSLESRSPFLDPDLAQFVLGLHPKDRLPAAAAKSLLKASCGALWPDSLQNRSKQGFGAPMKTWLERPDVRALRDRVAASDSALRHWIPNATPDFFQKARPRLAWAVLTAGLWLEKRAS